jgi:hypothetical protein
VRARVGDDGAASCIEHLPVTRDPTALPRWLADGFFSRGDAIGHPSWGSRLLPLAASPACFARGARARPPRAVVACERRRGAASASTLWAPGHLYDFSGPDDANDIGGVIGADVGPVLPLPDRARSTFDDRRIIVSRWLDLEAPRILTAPPMRPLAIAAFAGVHSFALAEELTERSPAVWLLDFEHGTRELVGKVADCPGQLAELHENWAAKRQRFLVLACLTPELKHSVGQALIWAEIVDTERRVRLRTPLLPEVFFPDGLVVLSTRRALAAESKAAPGELFSVDLAAP